MSSRFLAVAAFGVALTFGLVSSSYGAFAFWHFNDTTNLGTSLEQIDPLGTTASMTDYSRDDGPLNAHLSTWGGGLADGNLSGTNGVASGSTSNNFGSFVGTTDGDRGFGSGGSLSIVGTDNNLRYFTIKINETLSDGALSYWTRGTGTGYTTHSIDFSIDGGANWSTPTTLSANQTSSWQERVVPLGSVFAASSNNVIRVTVSGATGTSGNNRFDNIAIIPEPASLGLLCLSGLLLRRRR